MAELASHILCMSDSEIGAWLRKAVGDCLNGCVNEDADEFIKKQFNYTVAKMRQKQEHDARTYRNRIARQGKEAATTPLPLISTNDNAQTQTDSGAASLRGLKSSNGVSHCSEAPESNLLPLDNAKKPYGTCGHVMLTDAEGHHLREVYGLNLKIAIDILDSYIENNGRKAKKYKNHAAVLRKGNWVWDKVQEMVLKQARIDKATNGQKTFKQIDRDERTKFFKDTSVVERMIQNEQQAI